MPVVQTKVHDVFTAHRIIATTLIASLSVGLMVMVLWISTAVTLIIELLSVAVCATIASLVSTLVGMGTCILPMLVLVVIIMLSVTAYIGIVTFFDPQIVLLIVIKIKIADEMHA